MFESIINSSTTDGAVYVGPSIICIVAALAFGLVIAYTYAVSTAKRERSASFMLTMVILPAVTAAVILLVGSNVARAFSMAGIFALIRFRSQPGDAKDISLVFLAATVGLASGLGYLALAALIAVIICAAIILVFFGCSAIFKDNTKDLKILVPEDMNFEDKFDDLLKKYTKSYELIKVKTTNLGSMYELFYIIEMNPSLSTKEMMDEIRCRNGNLNVSVSKHETRKDTL